MYTVPPRVSQCCMFYLLILARLCFDYLKALALLRLRPNGAPPTDGGRSEGQAGRVEERSLVSLP